MGVKLIWVFGNVFKFGYLTLPTTYLTELEKAFPSALYTRTSNVNSNALSTVIC
jgi:hypothetical protein